jgi:aminopeptidase-like protein
MLSKYGLYPECGGSLKLKKDMKNELVIALWLLFYCDGENSLFNISEKLDVTIESLYSVAIKLEEKNLLERAL